MEKPDIKGLGLELLEENAKVIITKMMRPYAEYYIYEQKLKLGGFDVGPILLPFIGHFEQSLLGFAEQINKADNV